MKHFSISEVSLLSGIQPPTLRIWEYRYGFPLPERTGTNVRSYSLSGLGQLLRLALLSRWGYRISTLARMSDAELSATVDRIRQPEGRCEALQVELLLAMYRFDIARFEVLLQQGGEALGTDALVDEVIHPFLQKTGLLYQGRRRTEEHLVVTLLRKKLLWAIESLPPGQAGSRTVLLFLTDLRLLDLGLLYTHYRLARCGVAVVNLGNDISVANLRGVCNTRGAEFLFTYLPEKTRTFPSNLVAFMDEQAGMQLLYPSGPATVAANIHKLALPDAVAVMCDTATLSLPRLA